MPLLKDAIGDYVSDELRQMGRAFLNAHLDTSEFLLVSLKVDSYTRGRLTLCSII